MHVCIYTSICWLTVYYSTDGSICWFNNHVSAPPHVCTFHYSTSTAGHRINLGCLSHRKSTVSVSCVCWLNCAIEAFSWENFILGCVNGCLNVFHMVHSLKQTFTLWWIHTHFLQLCNFDNIKVITVLNSSLNGYVVIILH
jgi:hypothetical protein